MIKQLLYAFSLSALFYGQASACGGWDDDYDTFYSKKIFNQEIIEDPGYTPFLRTGSFCYGSERSYSQNCKDWANYFGITPEEACYLVNKASKTSIDQLLQSGKAVDPKLKFADKNFCKAKKAGLTYLAYAKHLEPYMDTQNEDEYDIWRYRYLKKPLDELEYDETIENLINACEAQTDKDLKIRYGYQIVRLAHYKGHNQEAVQYFEKYVESLNHKPEVYYYALSQKAGALLNCYDCKTSTGRDRQAIADFLKVFSESKDMKFSAFKSLHYSHVLPEAEKMLRNTKGDDVCNLYFILAYNNFNNPINELEKIININPNAPQAKVLMSRFISEVEDNVFCWYGEFKNTARTHFRNIDKAIQLAESQAQKTQNKDFWNLATAFLQTFCLDYGKAKSSLGKVNPQSDLLKEQKELLATIIDINEPTVLTDININSAFKSHEKTFDNNTVRQILAHRFQEINAKGKEALARGVNYNDTPNRLIWEEIIALAKKSNKSPFEKWLLGENVDMKMLNNNLAMAYFYEGNIASAYPLLNEDKDSEFRIHSKYALGYTVAHIIYNDVDEDYNTFYTDYVTEIMDKTSFVNITMKEALDHLNKLYKLSEGSSDQAAKANFLIGNFYYNFSHEGYYRNQFYFNSEFPTIAAFYYTKALKKATDDELKAHILFGLAKTIGGRYSPQNGAEEGEKTPSYFEMLNELKHTNFHKVAVTKCSYFADFVNSND